MDTQRPLEFTIIFKMTKQLKNDYLSILIKTTIKDFPLIFES